MSATRLTALVVAASLVASACSSDPTPGPDAAADIPTVDTPIVDTPTIDTPTVDIPTADTPSQDTPPVDVAVDAGPPDAPPADVPTMDVAVVDTPIIDVPVTDTPVTDTPVADVPRDAGPSPDAPLIDDGFNQELRPPMRSSACALWEQVPPQCTYAPLADDPTGPWAVCNTNSVMHYTSAGWTRTLFRLPPPFPTQGLRAVATGNGWVAAVGYASSGFVFLRRAGTWTSIPLPSGLTQPDVAWGAGDDLFIGGSNGVVFRYDGATWTPLWTLVGAGFPRRLWGTRSDLYETHSQGIRHYDGSSWTDLPFSSVVPFRSVGGVGSEVLTITDSGLYRVMGNTLQALPSPTTCATVQYYDLSTNAGGAVVTGVCDGAPIAWRRTGSTWSALPTPPYTSGTFLAKLTASGEVFLTGTQGPPAHRLVGGAWQSLVESEAPQGQLLTARSPTDVWTAGPAGITHLEPDGSWQTVPGSESLDVRAMWASPTGTLFVATYASGTYTLRRHDAAGWHTDGSVAGTRGVHLIGRSSTDVFVAATLNIAHWNGSTWTPLSSPCASTDVATVYLAGANVYARCLASGISSSWRRLDGSSWTTLSIPGDPVQAGPAANPSFSVVTYGDPMTVRVQSPDGLLSTVYLPPISDVRVAGDDPRVLVGGRFERSRASGATVLSDWITQLLPTTGAARWTDGRYVLGVGPVSSDPRAGRVARCDLGP